MRASIERTITNESNVSPLTGRTHGRDSSAASRSISSSPHVFAQARTLRAAFGAAALLPDAAGSKVPVPETIGPETSQALPIQLMTMDDGRTKIGLLTGEADGGKTQKRSSFYESDDEEEDEVGDEQQGVPVEAAKEYERLRGELEGLGWQFKKGTETHCYTEVIRHFSADDEGAPLEDLLETQMLPSIVEKTVYYDPECPLVDLIHELDHVRQQEAYFQQNETYLYTTWDAHDWGGKKFEEPASTFHSDELREFTGKVVHASNDWTPMSDHQNHIAEYHNYLREFLRYVSWGADKKEQQEIARKVSEHRLPAKQAMAKVNDESDYGGDIQQFIDACQAIQPFPELEAAYEAQHGQELEKI